MPVSIDEALEHATRCQEPRQAVASLDSALHLGLVSMADVRGILARLPRRHAWMLDRLDPRAESGQESVLRLALEDYGLAVEPQVTVPGVGRVDFLVQGTVVVEADSRAHHSSWEAQVRDRQRDMVLASRGIPSLRPVYDHVMFDTDRVVTAVARLVESVAVSGSAR